LKTIIKKECLGVIVAVPFRGIVMRIAMLHGYLLHGSGSNIYVQNITRELAKLGHEVHLFCQETHPRQFSFIKKAVLVEDGKMTEYYQRDGEDGAILVNPSLELLPVYVMDRYEDFQQVKLFINLSTEEVNEYIQRNISNISVFFEQFEYDVIHANHLVMMPYLAKCLGELYQIPYIITPHGSALVYTIQKDPRYEKFAIEGLQNARYIIPGNLNFRDRILLYFEGAIPNLHNKIQIVSLGVDTKLFVPIPKDNRKTAISWLFELFSQISGGKKRKDESDFLQRISLMDKGSINTILNNIPLYSQKKPDESITQKLQTIDPLTDRVLIFCGRLIAGKGIQNFLAAISPLLTRHSDLKVLVVGAGPMREWGEWFVRAGSIGNYDLMKSLINWVKHNPPNDDHLWEPLDHFLDSEDLRYFQSNRFDPSRVIFTGFLDHVCLAPLLTLAEWACFPSLVPESFGLVLVEAAACGVIPIATYFSGFKEILDQFKSILPEPVFPLLTLPFSGIEVIPHLIENLSTLIKTNPQISLSLREIAVRKFSWEQIAIQLVQIYSEISENPIISD